MNRKGPFLIFYFLVAYILLQFGWWTYLMVDLNKQVVEQKTEIRELKGEEMHEEEADLSGRFWMIFGEGSVFLLLLILGVVRIKRSFDKEILLARQQKNFLMAITHELKSPMASIKLFLQTLKKREMEMEQRQSIAGKAIGETERLNALVENILLANKLDDSDLRVNLETADMEELVNNTLSTPIETLGRNHDTRLELQSGLKAKVDRSAFESVILNLYENAVKYSPESSVITVFLKQEEGQVRLGVLDEGIGMKKQEVDKITHKFYRVGNEQTRMAKGTGLGLYIVKEIVRIHQGRMSIESEKGKGTAFNIYLPLVKS